MAKHIKYAITLRQIINIFISQALLTEHSYI